MKRTIAVFFVAFLVMTMVFAGGSTEKKEIEFGKDYSVVTIGENVTFATLDPATQSSVLGSAYYCIYETLIGSCDGTYYPLIAKDWSTADGGLTYQVTLYDNVYDSDGNHITASDVIFSYDIRQGVSPLSIISSYRALDDYTLEFVLTSVGIGNIETTLTYASIISKAAYESSANGMASNPITTSCYNVTDFVAGAYVIVSKNDNYWQKDTSLAPAYTNAKYDTVKFVSITEAAQQEIALETGTVDAIQNMDKTVVPDFRDGGTYASDFTAYSVEGGSVYSLYFSGSASSAVSNDENLRKAIAYAINKTNVTKIWSGGLGTVSMLCYGTALVDDAPDYYTEPCWNYNVELAKEYLAKSNYKSGTKLRLLSTTAFSKGTQTIVYFLNQIGIEVEVSEPDLAVYQKTYNDPTKYDLTLSVNACSYNTALWFKQLYNAKGVTKHGWSDTELFAAVKEANTFEGHTQENINKVSQMLDERCYAFSIWSGGRYNIVKNSIADGVAYPRIGGAYSPVWAY